MLWHILPAVCIAAGFFYHFAMRLLLFLCLLISKPVSGNELLGLPPLRIPADNPQTAEKVALGRDLFQDPRFSADGTISCASCHQPDRTFVDGLPVATGIGRQKGFRNTPSVLNAAFYTTWFDDGRAPSLEIQVLGPMLNPVEHGLKNARQIVQVVQKEPRYRRRMARIFKINASDISVEHITMAIASYERTLIGGNSPFDQYYFARQRARISASAARGLRIFRRKGNCANCHEISMNNALFSDNRFYNIGVGSKQLKPVLDELVKTLEQGLEAGQFPLTTRQRSELGRFNVSQVIADIGKFKTPILRNVALTAPYMHDGSLKSLEQVVEYYDRGGDKNRFLDPAIFPLHLSDREKADLVEFMKSLTSSEAAGTHPGP